MNKTEILKLWRGFEGQGPDALLAFAKNVELAAWEEFAELSAKRAGTERYKILTAGTTDLLEEVVHHYMNLGWLPLGGASVCSMPNGTGRCNFMHQQAEANRGSCSDELRPPVDRQSPRLRFCSALCQPAW